MTHKNNTRKPSLLPNEDPSDPAWIFRTPRPSEAQNLREQLRQVQADHDIYKKAFAHQQRQLDSLQDRVKELESRHSQRQAAPHLITCSVLTAPFAPNPKQPCSSPSTTASVTKVTPVPPLPPTILPVSKTLAEPKPTSSTKTSHLSPTKDDSSTPPPSENSPPLCVPTPSTRCNSAHCNTHHQVCTIHH